MNKIFPQKLKAGDEVRVVAPSQSLTIINRETQENANKRFHELGLKLTFGKHIEEMDEFRSSSIESRVEDLHQAFADKKVKAVYSVIGGFNSNQLLRYIDWDLIKNNPKVFCGYSDFTAMNNSFFAKTGLITYSGPAYSTLGKMLDMEYSIEYIRKCLFSDEPYEIKPSEKWDDRRWWADQKDRTAFDNPGWITINPGKAEGTLLGANLCTFNLLQGTEYFPDLIDSILFLEDDEESQPFHFDRNLQSLIHQPSFSGVKGIVIGRFQKASQMTDGLLIKIIRTKKELDNIPIIANVDFGHSYPMITYPIGGEVEIESGKNNSIKITRH